MTTKLIQLSEEAFFSWFGWNMPHNHSPMEQYQTHILTRIMSMTSSGYIFTCLNQKSINWLQTIHNSAARLLTKTKRHDHLSLVLALHWLPVCFPIDFKILVFTFKALHGLSPSYISDFLVIQRIAPRGSLAVSSVCQLKELWCLYPVMDGKQTLWLRQSYKQSQPINTVLQEHRREGYNLIVGCLLALWEMMWELKMKFLLQNQCGSRNVQMKQTI